MKNALCLNQKKCQNCLYINQEYPESLFLKEKKLAEAFKDFPKIQVILAERPFNYRKKVVLSAYMEKNKLRLGLYERGSKKVFPCLDCLIQDEAINKLLKVVEEVLNRYKISAYDIDQNKGILKHVLVRKGAVTEELLIVFVVNGHSLSGHKKIVGDLISTNSNIKTVVLNLQNKKSSLVLLENEKVVYGSGYIYDFIGAYKFRLSARSFYQINPEMAFLLYQKALEMARISSRDLVVDCYSGIGTISLLAAQKAFKVIAIESNKKAHDDAIYNKKLNKANNVLFINQDVTSYLLEFQKKVDVLILDPTRSGLTSSLIFAIKRIKPQKIVYISCFYETQLRDLKELSLLYDVKKILMVDMFPFTEHTETCVLLELKK